MKLSVKIIALRKRMGWSQEDLAEHLGVSRQSVSKWESGASVPELERIIQLSDLFGLSADELIRNDAPLNPPRHEPEPEIDRDHPILTLEDAYAYLAQCQDFAHDAGLGVAACVLSPAPLLALIGLFGEGFGSAVGVPMLLLLVAWAVYRFIMAGLAMQRYRHIEKGRFVPARGVMKWARESLSQFRPEFVRKISIGVALCIVSPGPLIFLTSFLDGSPFAAGFGTGLLLALVAAGCYLFTHTGCIQNSYRRLLKGR